MAHFNLTFVITKYRSFILIQEETAEKTKLLGDSQIQIATLSRRSETKDTSTATDPPAENTKTCKTEASTQTTTSPKEVVASVPMDEEKVCPDNTYKKGEGNNSVSDHQHLSESMPPAAGPIKDTVPDEYGVKLDSEENTSGADYHDILANKEQENLSQLGSSRPLLDRCLKRMSTDKVVDFNADIDVKLREEKAQMVAEELNQSTNTIMSQQGLRKHPPSDYEANKVTQSGDTEGDLQQPYANGPDNEPEEIVKEIPPSAEKETQCVDFRQEGTDKRNTEYQKSKGTIGKAVDGKLDASKSSKARKYSLEDLRLKENEHSLSSPASVVSEAKSLPSVVTNEAGQMFLSKTVEGTPVVRAISPPATVPLTKTSEDPALTRFKGLAHLSSPPLLSSPVIRRLGGIPPLPSPGGRYSFRLPLFCGSTSSDNSVKHSEITSNKAITPRRETSFFKPSAVTSSAESITRSTGNVSGHPITARCDTTVVKPSITGNSLESRRETTVFKPSTMSAGMSSPTSYNDKGLSNLRTILPTSAGGSLTSRAPISSPSLMSSARWFTKIASVQENVRKPPGSKDNSQEWPDFEGEFSADSNSEPSMDAKVSMVPLYILLLAVSVFGRDHT